MKEKTIIELEDTDAALILKEEGVEFYFPDCSDENSEVPQNVMIITILSILLKNQDEEFENLLYRKIDEFFNEEKGEVK